MFEAIARVFSQFGNVFKELSRPKQIGVIGVLLLVVGGFLSIFLVSGSAQYDVLYANLDEKDAAQIVEKLKELRVPYRLAGQGKVITVPPEMVYDARLSLAAEGLPRGGGVGFEIFNEAKIGATEFMQRINYQRALQGELTRTINQFDEVRSSRVHIVVPEETLFISQQRPPTAAVVLDLADGAQLNKSQIRSVVNLVSGAVEGLTQENVTVVDTTGRVLYDKTDESLEVGLSQTQLEAKRKVEADLAAKIQTMMDRVIGPGKTIARVSADVNFNREQLTEEEYDPDSPTIRSSQTTEENQVGSGPKAGGSPDEQFKITAPTTVQGAGQEKYNFSRTNETINYEINKINRKIIKSTGEIQRLSVAVILDGKYTVGQGADGNPTRTFTPRTDQEMARFTTLIRSAVGFSQARGDVIEVSSMAFETMAPTLVATGMVDRALAIGKSYGTTIVTVLLIILFFLFVVRPMLRWSGRELKEVVVEAEKLPTPEEELAGELEDLRKKAGAREKALAMVGKEPDLALAVIRSWLHEGDAAAAGDRV